MLGRFFAIAVLVATPAAVWAGDDMPLARAPSEMTGAEIDAHNEGLANADPNYIRCRKIEEIGSLVKKIRVCNTNAQWKKIVDKGNQDARDSMEMLARGWSVPQEPVDQLGPAINQPQ
jgi:hypothetical protein